MFSTLFDFQSMVLQWRHKGRDGVSNQQPHDCYPTAYSGAGQRKHQSSASLAFVWGIHQWLANFPLKWPVTLKMFPFDDEIIGWRNLVMQHESFSGSHIRHYRSSVTKPSRLVTRGPLIPCCTDISAKYQILTWYEISCNNITIL